MAASKNSSADCNQSARIAGALKCLDALRKLERAAESDNLDQTASDFYAQNLSDARALVAALGPMSPELEGAIAALAEYIHNNIVSGTPNLEPDGWIPMSAMTDEERQAMVDSCEAEHAADEAEFGTPRNVIQMAEHRPAQ